MPPIVSVIGNSKSGKTTLIEKLIQELKSRGYRVATIKHIPQGTLMSRVRIAGTTFKQGARLRLLAPRIRL